MDRRGFLHRVSMASLVAAFGGGGCVPEKPRQRTSDAKPSATSASKYRTHDLTGRARDRRKGITPGALEAEGGRRDRPVRRSAEKRETNS